MDDMSEENDGKPRPKRLADAFPKTAGGHLTFPKTAGAHLTAGLLPRDKTADAMKVFNRVAEAMAVTARPHASAIAFAEQETAKLSRLSAVLARDTSTVEAIKKMDSIVGAYARATGKQGDAVTKLLESSGIMRTPEVATYRDTSSWTPVIPPRRSDPSAVAMLEVMQEMLLEVREANDAREVAERAQRKSKWRWFWLGAGASIVVSVASQGIANVLF